jgi:polygalacturonase
LGLASHRLPTALAGCLLLVLGASSPALAADGPAVVSVVSPIADPAATPTGVVHGDRRVVQEPVAPTTTCATVPAQVPMAERLASAADESRPPDTARIQAALDRCAGSGGAVLLAASSTTAAFLSAPLTVRAGEVLVLDPAVVLHASRNAADYQVAGRARCGTIAGAGDGCRPFINLSSRSGIESSRRPGASQGRIDGRGDLPVLGQAVSWWQLAASAKQAGKQNVPRLIVATRADEVTLHDVDLVDSPGTHVSFDHGDGFTVWGVRIRTPAGARNTDGIDPAGATDVTIAHSWISAGDDGIAVKAGTEASTHISLLDDHLFGTHGVAIGSETTAGVSDVLVAGVTVSGRDAFGTLSIAAGGIRIKSSVESGGLVQDVQYRDVCVDEVKHPMVFDPSYAEKVGTSIPTFTRIVVDGFRASRSLHLASSALEGFDAAHPLGLALRRTSVDAARVDMAVADITTAGATFGGAPLASTRPDVRVTAGPDAGALPTCAFPAFPAL